MIQARLKLNGQTQPYQATIIPSNGTVQLNGQHYHAKDLPLDVPISGTVYGTLLNYKGNMTDLGEALYQPPYNEPPKAPILYIKPKNTLIGSGQSIPLPTGIDEVEVGASLGIVIGKTATCITEEQAFDFIEGYTIVNDVSVPHDNYYRPAVKHKARDGFCPIGPWVVLKEEVPNPNDLEITVYVNDEIKQVNSTINLIRPIPKLIADITEFMSLYPGDVVLIGVPKNRPLVKADDKIRIQIEGIGFLENTVVKEEELLRREIR